MSMTVEIHIRGLGLCFAKRDAWNVVFVCDQYHPVTFSYSGAAPVPLHAIGRDREIAFSGAGLVDGLPRAGPGYDRILNLAADYAHGPGVLNEKRTTGKTDIVAMRVPSATVGMYLPTPHDCFIQDAAYLGAPVEILRPIAKVINATFEVKGDLTMTVKDVNGPSIEPVFSFPYLDGGSLLLEFDNDCGGDCVKNDFLDFYDVVEDPSGRKFVAGPVKKTSFDKNLVGSDRLTGTVFSSRTSNCEPADIDPPPGG